MKVATNPADWELRVLRFAEGWGCPEERAQETQSVPDRRAAGSALRSPFPGVSGFAPAR